MNLLDETFQIIWTGAKYGITRNLDIIAANYLESRTQYTDSTACAIGTAGKAQCAGTFDMASAVLDWRFLPKWDSYIGTMYSVAAGGLANGDIARNNLATTCGVRFRF